MSELEPMIADLALILICASAMTLIFKWLKQPLVLGYIVAGFLASPNMPYMPSVTDLANIHLWSDIGVIFLLFALGLEFSFKKIMKMGAAPIIAACTVIFFMMTIGITVGHIFGWQKMDCIFLGGMLAMSSTTIIFKAFDDMGLRQQRFAGMVLSVLIIEDILAIVMMVMLSTMAVSQQFEGTQMIGSITKLVFFLVLWFVVGIYLIPLFLRKIKPLVSNETMLIVSLGLCFGMVVTATEVGYSAAFGAFIMGSILAETVEAENIEHLVTPVKDLFGAIFFVSVGMMVDVQLIGTYIVPILCTIGAIMLGQTIFGSLGFLISGQPLKVAMQCGFSLTQIGEFAFILATLGTSLGVTSEFLYPIVVAVSVFTTFTTPYMIRLATPAYGFVERHLPNKWRIWLEHYTTSEPSVVGQENHWRSYILQTGKQVLIWGVLCIGIAMLIFTYLQPLVDSFIPAPWSKVAVAAFTLLQLAPFLYAMMRRHAQTPDRDALWQASRFNHIPLMAVGLFRMFLGAIIIASIISYAVHWGGAILFVAAVSVAYFIAKSNSLQLRATRLEKTFTENLNQREHQAERNKPKYARRLVERDIHLSDFLIPADIPWAGQTLAELNLGHQFGVHVVSVLRGQRRINIPSGNTRILPGDRLQVIGSDEQLNNFRQMLEKQVATSRANADFKQDAEMRLQRITFEFGSPFIGKSIKDNGIRERFHCLAVGLESNDSNELISPDPNQPLIAGDTLWVVGEEAHLNELQRENSPQAPVIE